MRALYSFVIDDNPRFIAEAGHFRELPVEYNFPTHIAKKVPRGTYARPVMLHYHRALDRRGRLRRSGIRWVDESVREANCMITGFYGRWVLPAAGVLLALATVAGALGAHLLVARWSASRLGIYDIAVRYQFYQSLGLLAMGVLLRGIHPDNLTSARRLAVQSFLSAPRLLFVGIVLFCGSLYALSLGATSRWIELATPCGGAMLIGGWLLFALYVWRLRAHE